MTEPSPEARQIAERHAGRWQIKDRAREIDALTEQRVTAALEPWEQLRMACADILGCDADWPQHGNAPLAIAAALQLRVNADRPAPEGAAPIRPSDPEVLQASLNALGSSHDGAVERDLAWTRCSTPSQEDTGSVSGEEPRCEGGIELSKIGERCPKCGATDNDLCAYLLGPGSASNTESSPTQTVAPPGPTAGDVDRARKLLRNFSHDWDMEAGVQNVADAFASAHAELLAQIREPRAEGWAEFRDTVKDRIWNAKAPFEKSHALEIINTHHQSYFDRRALADKLTEAK